MSGLFGSTVLEIAIGMTFVYLLVSLIVSAANEVIASALRWRANNLWDGIRRLLDDAKDNPGKQATGDGNTPGLAQKLYDHPMIRRLSLSGKKPSYIPSRTFALALLDVISEPTRDLKSQIESLVVTLPEEQKVKLRQGMKKISSTGLAAGELKTELLSAVNSLPESNDKKKLQDLINKIPTSLQELIDLLPTEDMKRTLRVLVEESEYDLEKLKENIEIWFNNSMDRVSGWYKRKSQFVQIALALVITFWANVDSILITKVLSNDTALRAAIVAQAGKEPAPANGGQGLTGDLNTLKNNFDDSINRIEGLGLPVGWTTEENGGNPDAQTNVQQGQSDVRKWPNDYRKWPGWYPGGGVTTSQWANLWGSTIRYHFFGWLMTIAAVSLGAPFWFDLLNKIINIRSSGKAPEEKPKKPKEVPQPMGPGETAEEQREKIDKATVK
jgi:hypothetical protein